MSILRKAMCLTGRHSGDWSLPGSRCDIVSVCSSCGKREEQTRHVWGQFGPWLYQNLEFDSPQIRTCLRCRQAERSRQTMR
jgi:hypothetical protein